MIFIDVITSPKALKGSRNIQGFALIRAVLFFSSDKFRLLN